MICIGPGTGVAPARAVLEARVHLGMKENTLYFGHRASEKDEHYAQEWSSLAESGHLTYRVTASRDGPEGTPRVYVQDLIRQDAKHIWQLVRVKGAWVYISGCARSLAPACACILTPIDHRIKCRPACALRWWTLLERRGKWGRKRRMLTLLGWRARRDSSKNAGVDDLDPLLGLEAE